MSQEFCQGQARALIDRLGLKEPPVDVEKVATSLGLRVSLVRGGAGFYGRLLRGRMLIEVEGTNHPHKRRFTIAHEIGHFVLGHDPALSRTNDRSTGDPTKSNDTQANWFASELLMPEPWVRASWKQCRNYKTMAEVFDVSPEAMFIRLEHLGLLGIEPRL